MLQASRSWLFGAILRRSYSTSTAPPQLGLAQVQESRFRMPTILTLRPEKLMYSDFLVFAGFKRFSFHTQLPLHSPSPPAGKDQRGLTKLAYARMPDDAESDAKLEGGAATARPKFVRMPFPEHAQGFLYLHQESGLPRPDSSVRMRCTPSLVKASAAHVALSGQEPGKKPAPRSDLAFFLPPSVSNTEIYEAFKAGYDLMHPNGLPWNIPVIFIAGRPHLKYIRMQLLANELFSESELLEYEETYKSTNKTEEPLADPE